MLNEDERQSIARSVLAMQIIAAALAAGVLAFLVIAIVLVGQDRAEQPFLSYLALGFAVLSIGAWMVVPNLMARQIRQSLAERELDDSDTARLQAVAQLVAAYQTRLIVGCAILEGAAFFSLVVYLLEAHPASLVVAAVLLLLIISQIPTLGRVEGWVSGTWESVRQMQSFGTRPRR